MPVGNLVMSCDCIVLLAFVFILNPKCHLTVYFFMQFSLLCVPTAFRHSRSVSAFTWSRLLSVFVSHQTARIHDHVSL